SRHSSSLNSAENDRRDLLMLVGLISVDSYSKRVHCPKSLGRSLTTLPNNRGNPHASVIHWLSLGTGASGTVAFGVNPTNEQLNQGLTLNETIRPGVGQVVAFVDPLGGISTPGFATFYVP
ncbi:hypothetical protein QMK17_26105, partial [Rhodococcus sp. G-MC3]|nr:hypothetical protein [Rhodococcus sp. G-MC3]